MIHPQTNLNRSAWAQRVRDSLRERGYYYEPEFCTDIVDAGSVLAAAKLLGRLYVPSGTDPDQPVILTQPSPTAPDWCPFDRRASIGWHHEFSARSGRP